MNQSKSTHAVWLVLASLLFGAVVVWGYLDQNHYFSHIQVTKITSRAWENHQAKECASWNARSDKPILECDEGHSEFQQDVPVRFYGDTRRDLDPDTLRLHWACQKSEESHPPITCRAASQP
jgi:hypothetical protein